MYRYWWLYPTNTEKGLTRWRHASSCEYVDRTPARSSCNSTRPVLQQNFSARVGGAAKSRGAVGLSGWGGGERRHEVTTELLPRRANGGAGAGPCSAAVEPLKFSKLAAMAHGKEDWKRHNHTFTQHQTKNPGPGRANCQLACRVRWDPVALPQSPLRFVARVSAYARRPHSIEGRSQSGAGPISSDSGFGFGVALEAAFSRSFIGIESGEQNSDMLFPIFGWCRRACRQTIRRNSLLPAMTHDVTPKKAKQLFEIAITYEIV